MLYKVALTFTSVGETLVCEHSNESYWAVLPSGTVYYAVQRGSNFKECGWNPSVWPLGWKLLRSIFEWQTSFSTTDARSSPCSASCIKFSPRIVCTTLWLMANIRSGRNAWITSSWWTAWPWLATKEREDNKSIILVQDAGNRWSIFSVLSLSGLTWVSDRLP